MTCLRWLFLGDGEAVLSCFAPFDGFTLLELEGSSEIEASVALRTLDAYFEGDRRSDVYSSLFRFFPRFSPGCSFAATSPDHSRRGCPKSVADDGMNRSGSPVRSMASTSSKNGVSSFRSDRSGVAFSRDSKEDRGGSRLKSVYINPCQKVHEISVL